MLEARVVGQHIAVRRVVQAVRSHVASTRPNKALVLSFQGGVGLGKNWLAECLAEALTKARNGLWYFQTPALTIDTIKQLPSYSGTTTYLIPTTMTNNGKEIGGRIPLLLACMPLLLQMRF